MYLLILLVMDQIVSLKTIETSSFIVARHTEGSMDYLLPKIWPSAATVCRRLHLSAYVAANYGCWAEAD